MRYIASVAMALMFLVQGAYADGIFPRSVSCREFTPAAIVFYNFRDQVNKRLRKDFWTVVSNRSGNKPPLCAIEDVPVSKAKILASAYSIMDNAVYLERLYRVVMPNGDVRFVVRNSRLPGLYI